MRTVTITATMPTRLFARVFTRRFARFTPSNPARLFRPNGGRRDGTDRPSGRLSRFPSGLGPRPLWLPVSRLEARS
ncbi:hypothetical protein DFJ69_0081 [Thermomonospora umbrina]|uniref:Uncharacterized protein n=1 Tax=Thermomonospora umbrina TaxID=111806 RepID=A0A3D9SSP5_9ACTN|nr:hypothetical protein DFJ69_0081 [Thermomonospora umbrina]